jgi:hypothetical protein
MVNAPKSGIIMLGEPYCKTAFRNTVSNLTNLIYLYYSELLFHVQETKLFIKLGQKLSIRT